MKAPSKPPESTTRDERLAAALRENLKRRKAQARAQQDDRQGGAKTEASKDKSPSR
jgi:hypothetical protein